MNIATRTPQNPPRVTSQASRPEAVIQFAIGTCPVGRVLVARSSIGVCAILLGDHARGLLSQLRRQFPSATLRNAPALLAGLLAEVSGAMERPHGGLDLALDVRGTNFQQRVWQALRGIPAGRTMSYRDVARRIGAPTAARAVARACAANSIALAIPCHRVVRNDGTVSGYRWGIERKRALLRQEAGG
jgi:AraC family transcriptional regulator of adaptative response/methylated-DNA-[protein]-cysteine methyltransferase